ncbi:MAG: sigma-70 family RNA polymerase sigma factor [Armatimonadetes bacterium]|nr:sigma-70 family RNA polymerase sigma factor [Armatimonadota bacterium]
MLTKEHRATTDLRDRFGSLVAACEADLLRTARRLSRYDEDRAQDLVQDAILRAYVAAKDGRFDLGASLPETRGYLQRIITNQFINEYRRKIKWDAGTDVETLTAGGQTGPVQTHAKSADVPGSRLDDETLDEPLEKALAALSEASRMVVQLVDIEERSYEETAQLLDVPIGTVRSRLARARQNLRELLSEYAQAKGLI